MTKLLRDVRKWLARRQPERDVRVTQDVDPSWGEPSPFLGVVPSTEEGLVRDGEESEIDIPMPTGFMPYYAPKRVRREVDRSVPATGLDWAKAATLGTLPGDDELIAAYVAGNEPEKLACPETGEPCESYYCAVGECFRQDQAHRRWIVGEGRTPVGGEPGEVEPVTPAPDQEELKGATDLPDGADRELPVYEVRFQIKDGLTGDLLYSSGGDTVPSHNVRDLAAAVRDCLRGLRSKATDPPVSERPKPLTYGRQYWNSTVLKPADEQTVLPLGGGAGPAEVVVDTPPAGEAKVGVPGTVTPSPVLPGVPALLHETH